MWGEGQFFDLLLFVVAVVGGVQVSFVGRSQVVALDNERVDVLDELLYAGKVVLGKLFHVVVTCAVDVVRWILMFGRPVELLSMVKGHNLVSFAMNNVHGTVDIRHPVNVRELIKRESPSEVEHDS